MPQISIGIVIFIVVVAVIFQGIAYLFFSAWYFIQDYWLLILSIFSSLAIFGGENNKEKGIGLILALFFFVAHNFDGWIITDKERQQAIDYAETVSELYRLIGMKSTVNKASVKFELSLPYSSAVLRTLDFEDYFDEKFTSIYGSRFQNYSLYREMEVSFSEFRKNGGEVKGVIKDMDGVPVYSVVVKSPFKLSVDKI